MRRPKQKKAREKPDEADLSLRHLSRRFPEALASHVLPHDQRVASAQWCETQVTARQRRVDRALRVRLVGGTDRLLHWEWTVRLTHRVRVRTWEYHHLIALSAEIDTRAERKKSRRRTLEALPVESVIVVLTGRKKKWPEYGAYRTSPKGSKFCGVRYRIEAVYQRTVAELDAMGSVFWLAFVPLAVDADEEKIRVVIESLRTRTNEDDFAELGATMLAMAALKKKDAPNLVDMIRSLLSSEVSMQHPFYQEGLAKGLEQGLEKGLEQGREQGREEARKAFAVLAHQFERRLRRKMTDAERRRVAVRLRKDGPEKLGDVVLDLSRDELNAWLAPRKSTTPKRAA